MSITRVLESVLTRTALLLAIALLAGCDDPAPAQPAVPSPGSESPNSPSPNSSSPGSATSESAKPAEPPRERYAEDRFYIAHDLFHSADKPGLVGATAADRFLKPNDEVLGFVLDGEARAYSVQMLSYHHVVNDVIGETPIAVTY